MNYLKNSLNALLKPYNLFLSKLSRTQQSTRNNPPLVAYIILAIIWFVVYVYLSTKYLPSFYYASTDWITLSDRLLSPSEWGLPLKENNTASLRTIGYPIYLIITTLGSLDPNLIVNTNYLLAFTTIFASFAITSRIINYKLALLVSCIFVLSFVPFAFASTILSEHLIISLLTILAPLIVLSICKASPTNRFFVVLILGFLCLVKTLFFPVLLLYSLFLIIEWKFSDSARSSKGYKLPIAFSFLALILAFFSNSLFVKNHNSGTFIFGAMNTIMYGSTACLDNLQSIYKPLIDEGIFDEAKARDTLRRMDIKANNVLDRSKMSYNDVFETIFSNPTLETYWQIKWVLLNRMPSEKRANDLARSLYISYIKKYPIEFIKNTGRNYYNFILGKPRHFNYSYNTENLFRNEGGLRVYRTNKATNENLSSFFETYDIKINDYVTTKRAPKFGIKEDVIIRKFIECVFVFNAIAFVVWSIVSTVCLCKHFKNKLYENSPSWLNLLISSFLLQAFFWGSALGSVLFHPALGRYILPFLPIVLTSLVVTCCSVSLSLRDLFKSKSPIVN